MNTRFKYITMAVAMAASIGASSCSDILEEEPRGIFEPSYLETSDGIAGGLVSLYGGLRYLYGDMYWNSSLETGTDEFTYAQSADNNWKDADMSGVGQVTPESMRSDHLWGQAFKNINACNSLLTLGKDDALLAEARFFRAFYYFHLVRTFGGVPLDLGAGELQPNYETVRASKRNTVPEVYKVIFNDLEFAVEKLADKPRFTGAVSKNVARLYLSKAYLTFGWWLQDTRATYPQCDRTSLHSSLKTAEQFYQKAYDIALDGINNPGPYKLMPTYRDVHLAQNDRSNTEVMLIADRTQSNQDYNGGDLGYAGGSGTENVTAWATTWNYTNLRAWFVNDKGETVQGDPCGREAAQAYGRPWTRTCPTHDGLAYFTDRNMDSRYDGSFVTAFRGNWQRNNQKGREYYINKEEKQVIEEDGIILLITNEAVEGVAYPESGLGESNVGAGYKKGTPYWIMEPNMISRYAYPMLWKYGTYRTDNNGGMGSPNGSICRPFPVCKYSELYFIAAEAAVQGATGSMTARELINVIRERAGRWNFSNAENIAKNEDYSAELTAATPATIDIAYILDERAREYYGEGIRWYDLVRTGEWENRSKVYHIVDTGKKADGSADNTYKYLKEITRTIENHFWLRPIPKGQLDGMENSPEEKAAFQNPGY